jgi:D-alanine-D-alanine ligase-like ATP-grasp enzyme
MKPTALPNNRSRYSFIVARRSRALDYRVVVVPNNGGGNVNGRSRVVSVPKR